MDTQHTTGPWTFSRAPSNTKAAFTIYKVGQMEPLADLIPSSLLPDDRLQCEADARRIVACVNACEGISTENLEDNIPVKELATRYNAALRRRDELIAAMEEVLRISDRKRDAWDKVKAMIAEIKK